MVVSGFDDEWQDGIRFGSGLPQLSDEASNERVSRKRSSHVTQRFSKGKHVRKQIDVSLFQ